MASYRVITKRIVSPDGKAISEVKSVVTSIGNQTETSQTISVDISSSSSSSFSSSSSAITKGKSN